MHVKKIEMKNFKKFDSKIILCESQNILTGHNNAGKSTTLDALRIVHDILRYVSRRNATLMSFEDETCPGYEIPQSIIRLPIINLSKNYSEDPSQIRVQLENGSELIVVLHEAHAVKAYFRYNGVTTTDGKKLLQEFALKLIVVPTLGPVDENEHYLTDKTIHRSENTRTAHRHLRNILIRKSDAEFEEFSRIVSEAWPNISLEKPEVGFADQPMSMFFKENRIPREIFWSGFGFQVWMQIMLQFMRGDPTSTLILDEPDIYLHPTLQSLLIKMAKERFGQVFVATHSHAIIESAATGEIVEITDQTEIANRR